MTNPIQRLVATVQQIVKGQFSVRPESFRSVELNYLASEINSMSESLAAAGREMDQKKRFELFQQAEEILMTEVPIIPIYNYRNKALVHPAVKNWKPNPLDRHPYKYVYLEADE